MVGTVHRIIEQHAATRAHDVAVSDGERTISYRDLNCAANALARRLQGRGFRRGAHATVTMTPGIDLAVALLAVLKMGSSYTWREASPFADEPAGLSFADRAGAGDGEARFLHLDIAPVDDEPVASCANLPIVTRPTDVACVLIGPAGTPGVHVPHATIAALRTQPLPQPALWTGAPGAFDLWMALMSGTTAVVDSRATAAAA